MVSTNYVILRWIIMKDLKIKLIRIHRDFIEKDIGLLGCSVCCSSGGGYKFAF